MQSQKHEESKYDKGYGDQSLQQPSKISKELEVDLSSVSPRVRNYIWMLVITTLSILIIGSAIYALVLPLTGTLFPAPANISVAITIFSTSIGILIALLVSSPVDTVVRAVSTIIRYWRERQSEEAKRVQEAEERAQAAEIRLDHDRFNILAELQNERIKGIRLAENLKGRIREAGANKKDVIEVDDLVQMIEDIYPSVKP